MPFTATIAPAPSSCRACVTAASPCARGAGRAASGWVRTPDMPLSAHGSGDRTDRRTASRNARTAAIRHRRRGSVVGQLAHDRESRSAVGAADERVPVPHIAGIAEFAHAVVADTDIRRDKCSRRTSLGRSDDEIGAADDGVSVDIDGRDVCQRRRVNADAARELGYVVRVPRPPPRRLSAVFETQPDNAEFARECIDERTEPDALDEAVHLHTRTLARSRSPGHVVTSPPPIEPHRRAGTSGADATPESDTRNPASRHRPPRHIREILM